MVSREVIQAHFQGDTSFSLLTRRAGGTNVKPHA